MENNNKKVEDIENKLQLPLDTFKKTKKRGRKRKNNNLLYEQIINPMPKTKNKKVKKIKNVHQK